MPDSPNTRPSLLVRLRDQHDNEAWQQFVDLYGPVVYEFARKRGLQDADAADLMQIVMQQVAGAIGRFDYDPAIGTFRAWLFSVVRHHLSKFLAKQNRQVRGSGDTEAQRRLEAEPASDEESSLWDREYKRQRFLWAADQVRGEFEDASWQAFWQTAVDNKSAQETAAALGMSVGAVYTAKSRVLAKIRAVIERSDD